MRAFQLYIPPAAAALAALEGRGCRWPIGEVDREGFRFCGVLRLRGPYCRAHGSLAFRGRR